MKMNNLIELAVGGATVVGAVAEITIAPLIQETNPVQKTPEAQIRHLRHTLIAGVVGAAVVGHAVYSIVKDR